MKSLLQMFLITALLSIILNTLLVKRNFSIIIGNIVAGVFSTYTFLLRKCEEVTDSMIAGALSCDMMNGRSLVLKGN